MRPRLRAVLTAALFFAGMNAAVAASPVGQWNVTFYLEPNLTKGVTQGVCYKADGTWFSTTFAGWHGGWFQKGDRFRWYGITSVPALGTAQFGQMSSGKHATGEAAHFDPGTGATVTNSNWVASKAGSICGPPASGTAARSGRDPAKP